MTIGTLKNIILSTNDFITGEKFYKFSDFVYSPNIKPEFDDYNKQINTFDIKKLKDLNIVYTHTLYVRNLFDIIKDLAAKFIVITHNSDINVDNTFIIPDNVNMWFSQNVNTINDKVSSIPIGLENERWFKDINKKQKMFDISKTEKNIKNLVYVNHNIKTNIGERQEPYDILKDKTFATIVHGTNGQNFDSYLDNIYNHKFVICPVGNGIDTHRLWECLYLNTIPIVKNNINNSFYTDLPVCFVDNWKDINKDFLENEYKRITNRLWNYNKLKIDYWEGLIDNYRN
jgi:hypothetical protein